MAIPGNRTRRELRGDYPYVWGTRSRSVSVEGGIVKERLWPGQHLEGLDTTARVKTHFVGNKETCLIKIGAAYATGYHRLRANRRWPNVHPYLHRAI